jgi:hypothetical protein
MNRQELYNLLQTALKAPSQRLDCIKRFQNAIFEGSQTALGLTDIEWDVFTQLAQDLDYYEPDAMMRREDPTFYGDERVADEIREALGKLDVQV